MTSSDPITATGIVAILAVTAVFFTVLIVVLIAERRRTRRYLKGLERKLDRVVYASMSPEERERARQRLEDIEREQRRAHGLGGY